MQHGVCGRRPIHSTSRGRRGGPSPVWRVLRDGNGCNGGEEKVAGNGRLAPRAAAGGPLRVLGDSGIMIVNSALIRCIYPSRLLGRGFGLNAVVVATAFTLGPT